MSDRPSIATEFVSRYAAWLDRHRVWILIVATIVTLPAAWLTARLYLELRSSVEELLPPDAPSVRALRELRRRIGGVSHLAIVVRGNDTAAMERFADALHARLVREPNTGISDVLYRADAERAFIGKARLLYAEAADLRRVRDALSERVRWERAHANPLLLDLEDEGPPPLNFEDLRGKYSQAGREIDRFDDDYFVGEGGHTLVMLAFAAQEVTDYESNARMIESVRRAARAVGPARFDPSIRILFGGDVAGRVQEQEALIRDLALSTAIVLLLVGLSLVVFYRSWRSLAIVGLPLLYGSAWAFAISYAVVGYLNANTAFLGSIVVGNGINFGIIFFARWVEERRRGGADVLAAARAIRTTAVATATAAAAAGIAYASLMVTSFRGFSQFGFIGAVGMACCWIASFTVLPALALALGRLRPGKVKVEHKPRLFGPIGTLVARWPRAIVLGTVAAVAASVVAVAGYARDPFEYDFVRLGSRSSVRDGAIAASKRVDRVFGALLTPTVLLTDRTDDAREARRLLLAAQSRGGGESQIVSVRTARSTLPADQRDKLPAIRDIQEILTPDVLRRLPARDRRDIERLLPPGPVEIVGLADLPPSVLRGLREKTGEVDRAVIVMAPVKSNGNGRRMTEFVREVRGAVRPLGDRVRVAGEWFVLADLLDAIARDGPLATLIAFAGVVLLSFLAFGRLRRAAWVVMTLVVGIVLFLGLMAASGVKINFLNFVALPITFGIGVDYTVNVYQRYRFEGPGSAAHAVTHSGGAVALCSWTTIIGYSSLLVADNRALFSFGLFAVLGELACLIVAVLFLPALLVWVDRRKVRPPTG